VRQPTIRKVPANSVPYGEQITRRGGYVWAAYDGDRLVCVAATVGEARRKFKRLTDGLPGRPADGLPPSTQYRRWNEPRKGSG
jgi:hypothetical protein